MTTKIQQLQKIARKIDGSLAVISLAIAIYYIGIQDLIPAIFWTIGATISTAAYIWPPMNWIFKCRYVK